jgi:hypothetical protein
MICALIARQAADAADRRPTGIDPQQVSYSNPIRHGLTRYDTVKHHVASRLIRYDTVCPRNSLFGTRHKYEMIRQASQFALHSGCRICHHARPTSAEWKAMRCMSNFDGTYRGRRTSSYHPRLETMSMNDIESFPFYQPIEVMQGSQVQNRPAHTMHTNYLDTNTCAPDFSEPFVATVQIAR